MRRGRLALYCNPAYFFHGRMHKKRCFPPWGWSERRSEIYHGNHSIALCRREKGRGGESEFNMTYTKMLHHHSECYFKEDAPDCGIFTRAYFSCKCLCLHHKIEVSISITVLEPRELCRRESVDHLQIGFLIFCLQVSTRCIFVASVLDRLRLGWKNSDQE